MADESTRKNTCFNCAFWERKQQEIWDDEKNQVWTGECHFMPPCMMGNYTKNPKTTERDWCGQHQDREAEI